jgi:hypothetical protein
MSDLYRRGDYYLICAQSGRKIRRSEAVKQWDGVWVHRDFCDEVNPLDWPRKATPQRPVYPVRPEPTDVFISLAGIDVDESWWRSPSRRRPAPIS